MATTRDEYDMEVEECKRKLIGVISELHHANSELGLADPSAGTNGANIEDFRGLMEQFRTLSHEDFYQLVGIVAADVAIGIKIPFIPRRQVNKEYWSFEIKSISAEYLKPLPFSRMDFYLVISMDDGNKPGNFVEKMDICRGTNPTWHPSKKFTVDKAAVQQGRFTLSFQLYREGFSGKKDIGKVRVPIKGLFSSVHDGECKQSKDFQVRKPSKNSEANLRFLYMFTKVAAGSEGAGAPEAQESVIVEPTSRPSPPSYPRPGAYPPPPAVHAGFPPQQRPGILGYGLLMGQLGNILPDLGFAASGDAGLGDFAFGNFGDAGF